MDLVAIAQGVRNALSSSSRSSAEEEEEGEEASGRNGGPSRLGLVMDVSDASFIGGFIPVLLEKHRHPYSRPEFLYFSDDDITISADKSIRPVICPKFPDRLPLLAGYAEVINAGKTQQNEDQATARMIHVVQQGYEAEEARELERSKNGPVATQNGRRQSDDDPLASPSFSMTSQSSAIGCPRLDAAFFAIFDGHAGTGASLMASKCLHEHIKSRLSEVLESLIELDRQESFQFGRNRSQSAYSITNGSGGPKRERSKITSDALVIGAMEAAYVDMDEQIAEEKQVFKIPGGCAVISALVVLGKVYIANAGDCRAILVSADKVKALSRDLTPGTERKRLQEIAYRQPELIGSCFSRLEYARVLTRKDLKKKVMYRDWFMDGWSVKTVRDSDLRHPLISDRFKKKRLLNTIGVSRGFGDHHLMTVEEKITIKPFLSPVPEVQVFDISSLSSVTDRDVVILASDGLWDVISNEDAALIVRSSFSSSDPNDQSRYSMAAQELVMAARGNPTEYHRWMMNCGGLASSDDITVFVIPLKHCLAPPSNEDEDDDEMINLD